jgi:hypothetical protein
VVSMNGLLGKEAKLCWRNCQSCLPRSVRDPTLRLVDTLVLESPYIHKNVSYRNAQKSPVGPHQKKWRVTCITKHREYWNKWIVDKCWIYVINKWYDMPESMQFTVVELHWAISPWSLCLKSN